MTSKPLFACALALSLLLAPALVAPALHAQSAREPAPAEHAPAEHRSIPADFVIHTYTLHNAVDQNDENYVLTALRNILEPTVHIMLVPSQNTIVLSAPPDQQAAAERVIRELDQPRKAFRLLYTLTELENGHSIGTHHYAIIVVSGQRTTLKQGDKVPVATGSFTTGNSSSQTQFTYLDVGINIDASLDPYAGGVRLKSKVEQSGVGPTNTIAGVQEPIIIQSVLEGTAFLTLGKPALLGSIDVPGTTRRYDISVELQPAS